MPAHIGFINMVKIPLGVVYQLTPTEGGRSIRTNGGLTSPAEIYRLKKKQAQGRDKIVTTYKKYREFLDLYEPGIKQEAGFRVKSVDPQEWDLYLARGTHFDRTMRALLDAKWKIDLVKRKSDAMSLKRIEAKRGQGHPSVTVWSRDGSAAGQLFEGRDESEASEAEGEA
ncbi:MAG: hypothetical protein JO055_18380 [Alphaproteobacteria bacterium]|nr:hypothetical protein [Alphaproteobacteria bacterium]